MAIGRPRCECYRANATARPGWSARVFPPPGLFGLDVLAGPHKAERFTLGIQFGTSTSDRGYDARHRELWCPQVVGDFLPRVYRLSKERWLADRGTEVRNLVNLANAGLVGNVTEGDRL